MLNTIKMDLYRMIRSKSSIIILAVLFGFVAFNISMLGLMSNNINLGLGVTNINVLESAFSFSRDAGSILFLCIFTVIYSNSMYKYGYIKNIAGKVNRRRDLIISNIVIILIYTLLVFITIFIAVTVGGFIGFKTLEFTGIKEFLLGSVWQYILSAALMMGVLFLVTLLRKSGGVMAIAIIYINGMGITLWNLIGALVNKYISENIEIVKYSIICSFGKMDMTSYVEFENYWLPMIVAIVWAAVFIIGSIVVMNRKDIA